MNLQGDSPFFALPLELRQQIYTLHRIRSSHKYAIALFFFGKFDPPRVRKLTLYVDAIDKMVPQLEFFRLLPRTAPSCRLRRESWSCVWSTSRGAYPSAVRR
jgi:hypothetical protein